jgi:hypothetical protein
MDALEFFNTVLPEKGRRCVGMLDGKMFRNFFGPSNEWADTAATRLDSKNINTYIALSGFGPENSRTQENVVAVRCSWLDIDTRESKPKETYANRKEALVELLAFCEATSMPKPLVVSSGYGLHVYWPYTRDVTRQQWKQIATLLKAACEKYGLAVDRSRTTDEASVLRPVGTHNYKNEPKLVKAVQRGEDVDPDDLLVILANYLGDDLDMFSQPAPSRMADLNSDLKGGITYQESSAELIAQHCGVVAHVRDTKGDTDQPTWYGILGVLAFTKEGEDKCHEWSNGYDGYSASETDTKIAQAKRYAPTTCEKLSQCQPDICKACPYFGKIKSPISLGTVRGEPQLIEVSPESPTQVSNAPFEYPSGYGYSVIDGEKDKCLWYVAKVPDDQGNLVDRKFFLCDVNLYPTARIQDGEGIGSMRLKMKTKRGYERDFNIDLHMIGRGDKSVMAELAKHEISVPAANRAKMEAYLNSWISKLRDEYIKTPSVTQYGWHENGIVSGSTFIAPDGDLKAVVTGSALKLSKHFEPTGDLDAWVDGVERGFNMPGFEGLQFNILLAFAAPLFSLYGVANGGVTVYAHSALSGYAKTSSQCVGLSAWCFHPKVILRENNFTINALFSRIGTLGNLPVIVDEMTNADAKFASALVFSASSGTGKARLQQDGSEQDTKDWSTIVAASGNRLLSEKLSLHRGNAQAELARIFEFTLTRRPPVPEGGAQALMKIFEDNYGIAGPVFARYLVDNRDKVTDMMFKVKAAFDKRNNIQTHERYWSMLIGSVLTALAICRKLKLVNFDVAAVQAWIEVELANNRGVVAASASDPLEQFGDMLNDIWRGVLVTEGEGNLAQGLHAAVIGHGPSGNITGRSIHPDRTSAAKLYIAVAAAKAWCEQHGYSFKEMSDALVKEGWASPTIKRMSLGKGTKQYSALGGPVKVWEINPSAVTSAMGSSVSAAKIVSVIQGGVDAATA